MVKAKIYKERPGGKINIAIEGPKENSIWWVDELVIDSKILRSLVKNFDKAQYVDDPMGISKL